MRFFHITTPGDWDVAVQSGHHVDPSLAAEGFIHGSFVHQVERSANKHFADRDGLLLVELESTRLDTELVIEDSYGSGQRFPHVYGPINASAAVATHGLHRDAEGRWVLPDAVRRAVAGLAPDYPTARHRFLLGAHLAGATITAHPHPERGLGGGELWLDVAEIGPERADHTLVIVSATHGVEGYAGSSLQCRLLHHLADTADTAAAADAVDTRIVMVHALNPYGFSWVRRVNEDNVDLNRNFVEWPDRPVNEGYRTFAADLVPTTWDEATQQATTLNLLGHIEALGMDAMQAAVSGGQYEFDTGVFYGGTGPVWSHRWLAEHLGPLLGGAGRATLVDLHTGLGPWGHGELISHERVGTPGYERGTELWGSVASMGDGESVSAELSGDWLGALEQFAPGVEWTAAALEYGTVDMITVLQSLRADAWLHAHGDPSSDDGPPIRAQVRAAFADDDPAWFDAIGARFDEVVGAVDPRLIAG